jgi:MYXO-CTERM domain-containing protein
MRALPPFLVFLACLALPRAAAAFCGFYVSGADTSLLNRATHVALMRSGTRTVLSMQNAYEGPPEDFALVVPVPVVLQKEQVKTLARQVLDRVDQLGAPRLVEYWEQDPCAIPAQSAPGGVGQGFGSGAGRLGGSHKSEEPAVKIEAQFEVGEYDIVILSATDATALDTWLRDNRYKIPAGAEPYLRPYVAAGMKFFVAKVNIKKVEMKDGRALLSPLRFHYDSETFSLPIRLGLINAGDAQDLVVSILSEGKRYEVANYPNVVIPTNLDVSDATRKSFGSFYAALLDETLKQKPGAVVTEYSWDAGKCDPCPGPTLSAADLATLGADTLAGGQRPALGGGGPSSVRMDPVQVTGRLPPEVIQRIVRQNLGRLRLCYEDALRKNPNLQGDLSIRFVIGREGSVSVAQGAGGTIQDPGMMECVARAYRGLSFPSPEGGIVTATQKVHFLPAGSGLRATGYVLTRLHMRYSKEALGEDLVFKEAQAITGGREVRGPDGRPEQGAVLASMNNFQARYAIRHAWTGPFAPRGAGLGAFLTAALPQVSGPMAAGAASSSAPPPAASSGTAPAAPSPVSSAPPDYPAGGHNCACSTVFNDAQAGWPAAAALLALALRRRRSAAKARA